MSSTDYDPRYPFVKPSKPAEAKKTRTTTEEKIPDSQKKEQSVRAKQGHPVRNTFLTLTILGVLGTIGYFGYEWYQDNQEKMGSTPSQGQVAEAVVGCPVYKAGTINATLQEREAYTYIDGGLDGQGRFSEDFRRAVVRETLLGLQSGMSKADALARAEKALFEGIAKDADTAVFRKNGVGHRVGYGLSRLETNFKPAIAVQTRDVSRILQAVPFCLEALKANLAVYSEDEAQTMLETFGSVMALPNLGREATKYVARNQEWAIEAQKKVLRETFERIGHGATPHDAICLSVYAVFEKNRGMSQTPIAFYAQAQTAKILQGKTRSQMLGALQENLTQLEKYPQGWIGQNNWLNSRMPVAPQNTQGGASR